MWGNLITQSKRDLLNKEYRPKKTAEFKQILHEYTQIRLLHCYTCVKIDQIVLLNFKDISRSYCTWCLASASIYLWHKANCLHALKQQMQYYFIYWVCYYTSEGIPTVSLATHLSGRQHFLFSGEQQVDNGKILFIL